MLMVKCAMIVIWKAWQVPFLVILPRISGGEGLGKNHNQTNYCLTWLICWYKTLIPESYILTSLCLIFSVHVREPGEEASRVQMDRRIHSVERDDRGKMFVQLCNMKWLYMHWSIVSRHISPEYLKYRYYFQVMWYDIIHNNIEHKV